MLGIVLIQYKNGIVTGMTDTKTRLSTSWIVVLINMIFADIFSIMVAIQNNSTFPISGDVEIAMAIAAVLTNIPILMIFLSRILPYKANRIVNIIAAIFTVIYVIGGAGGYFPPHYIIIAAIEVAFLLMIIVYSLKWKKPENGDGK